MPHAKTTNQEQEVDMTDRFKNTVFFLEENREYNHVYKTGGFIIHNISIL